MNWVRPEQAATMKWDVIVIGSGVGGSVAALAAAQRNQKVLVLTKKPGPSLLWQDHVFDVKSGKKMIPFLGDGIGGSSALYGMVMERLEASDFSDKGGAWPETQSLWHPYYEDAERIFGVQSAADVEGFKPFYQHLEAQGLTIKRLSLACRQVPGCEYCQARACEKRCKVSADSGPLSQALATGNVSLLSTDSVALRECLSGEFEVGLRSEGMTATVRARNTVLAAGALRTPTLLKAVSSLPAIGRYLMRHFVDCYVLDVRGYPALDEKTKIDMVRAKAWGTDSFYERDGEKLGTVQSFGTMPDFHHIWNELTQLHPILKYLPFARKTVEFVVRQVTSRPIAATIIEDEPRFENRVEARADGGVDLYYEISPGDQKKIKRMRSLVKHAFGSQLFKVLPEAENNFRLAHVCGTCRSGTDTNTSVVDSYGKVHGTERLWVADASVFPSSAGKNPALTIAAHALRMSERMLSQ